MRAVYMKDALNALSRLYPRIMTTLMLHQIVFDTNEIKPTEDGWKGRYLTFTDGVGNFPPRINILGVLNALCEDQPLFQRVNDKGQIEFYVKKEEKE